MITVIPQKIKLRMIVPGNEFYNEILPEEYLDVFLPHEERLLKKDGYIPENYIITGYRPGLKQRYSIKQWQETYGGELADIDGYTLFLTEK